MGWRAGATGYRLAPRLPGARRAPAVANSGWCWRATPRSMAAVRCRLIPASSSAPRIPRLPAPQAQACRRIHRSSGVSRRRGRGGWAGREMAPQESADAPPAPRRSSARSGRHARPAGTRSACRAAAGRPRSCRESRRCRCAPPTSLCQNSSVRAVVSDPAITSLWPFKYLVAECMTRSAPSASGRVRTGVAAVLSTASRPPTAWAISAAPAMSVIGHNGLAGVSIHTSRVAPAPRPRAAGRAISCR